MINTRHDIIGLMMYFRAHAKIADIQPALRYFNAFDGKIISHRLTKLRKPLAH